MESSLKFIVFSCFVSSTLEFLAGPSVENKTERTLPQDTQGSDAHTDLSPPQRNPLGIPIKIGVLEGKKHDARGGLWEKGKGGNKVSLPLFTLPIVSRALSFFLSPASLGHKEASTRGGE